VADSNQGRDVALEQREAAKLEKTAGITFGEALRQFANDTSSRDAPLAERTKADHLAMILPKGVGPSGRVRQAGELASIAEPNSGVSTARAAPLQPPGGSVARPAAQNS
jgi:hypothetical protein